VGAKSCPECGSDEKTGWSEETRYDATDIPDEDLDYDRFLEKEGLARPKRSRSQWIWFLVAAGLIVALALLFVLNH
jgi:hypothetical protein